MRSRLLLACCLLGALPLAAGCQKSSQSGLPTTTMKIGARQFTLEIANSEETRDVGLMRRDSMPADHGMIFVFKEEKPLDFWMKNTRIPLDIIYVAADGTIVSIKQMQPYKETSTLSDGPARFAIELNQDAATRAGAKAGDHLTIPAEAREAKD